jgi:hypothetical protein
VAQSDRATAPRVSGPPQLAARARTTPGGEVWFTVGQAWTVEADGEQGYAVRLTMIPTNWDGELLLVPIQEQRADGTFPAD